MENQDYKELFDLMLEQYGLTLTIEEMDKIIQASLWVALKKSDDTKKSNSITIENE